MLEKLSCFHQMYFRIWVIRQQIIKKRVEYVFNSLVFGSVSLSLVCNNSKLAWYLFNLIFGKFICFYDSMSDVGCRNKSCNASSRMYHLREVHNVTFQNTPRKLWIEQLHLLINQLKVRQTKDHQIHGQTSINQANWGVILKVRHKTFKGSLNCTLRC